MQADDMQTEHLVIRSTREVDGAFCLSIWLDDEMGRYLSDPPRSQAGESYLNFALGIEQDESWYPFVAVLREKGGLAGTCQRCPQR